ncbi:MAG: hypothetical protein FD174_1744 [Geobacteraceae bacterium]|nr:MAG: hypothetical protein FD174_1744 [Geobacteraceae bacterium]
MKYNPEIHRRRSIRLKGYDYSIAGAYFVTIRVHVGAGLPRPECLFGEIVEESVRLNPAGDIVQAVWEGLPEHYPHVVLDAFVIMPNHVHGIVAIVGAGSPRPISPDNQNQGGETQGGETPPLRKPTLGQIVGYFKYQTTKQINQMRDNPGVPVWQRNYYERVIRNENELTGIREYIQCNPKRWEEDEENPDFA